MTAPVSPPNEETSKKIPKLIRFLGLNMAMGAAIGIVFSSMVVLSNTGGLKDLLNGSKEPYFALGLLYFMNALTFASLTMGIAVMRLPYDPDGGRTGGGGPGAGDEPGPT